MTPAPAHAALVGLLDRLEAAGYAFVTPTPATHRLVSGRRVRARAGVLRDVFGWSLPFDRADLPPEIFGDLRQAGVLEAAGDLLRSTVRVSTVGGRLHLHSAPTSASDAVFLGPDSYRFVRFLDAALEGRTCQRALDIGVGAGAGALALASRRPEARVIGVDVNPAALRLFEANAAHQGLEVEAVIGSGPAAAEGPFDLMVANPPYVADGGRTYRDGGGDRGTALALAWVAEGVGRLTPGGRFLLYTGSPIEDGRDPVKTALADIAQMKGLTLDYEELDPDIFGSMLKQEAYRTVDRIAAVGAVLTRTA